jgi:hypothetical protein
MVEGVISIAPEDTGATRREATWFGWLFLWVAAVFVLGALLAPPVYHLVSPLFDEPQRFSRVARRVATLIAIGGLWFWIRSWGGFSRTGLGFPSRADGRARLLRAFAIGAVLGVAVFGVEWATGAWSWRYELTLEAALEATAGALFIGLLEEGVFRGFLLLQRPPLSAPAWAFRVGTISLLYSAAHFARGGKSRESPGPWAAFEVWSRIPASIGEQLDAFFGLAALGFLFAALAVRDRDCWRAAGLHAGIVGGIRLASECFEPVPGRVSPLLSSGVQPGWGSVLVLLAAGLILLVRPRPGSSG